MKKGIFHLLIFTMFLGLSSALAHPGIGIIMDSKGNVFYTDLIHVWKISPDGKRTIAVKDVHTHELHIDENDNLYGEHVWYEGEVTDKWGYYVWCLNNDGSLEQTIPPTEGFPINNTLVRDFEGNQYWSEKLGDGEILKRRSAAGHILLHTDHEFKDIRWMHIPPGKKVVYLIDYLTLKKVSENGEVQIISNELREPTEPHAAVGDHHYLMGIWSDQKENIYVAAYGARKVKKIKPNGTMETIVESSKNWSPSGGLSAPDGTLWLMEFSVRNKTRVRKITADGQETIFRND